MPSEMPKVPMRLLLLLPAMLACAACVSAGPVLATPSACSSLLPPDWVDGVSGAPLPDGDTVGDWIQFADAQTGQLDKSNDRYQAAVGIVSRCEERDREAVQRSRPRFLGL
jgi:cytochrome c553